MKKANVFLSHNTNDKSVVEKIGERLLLNDIQPWLDKWNLIPGEPWQEAIEEALDRCSVCIVFIGNTGIGPWQNEEMRSAIDRRVKEKSFRVIPVLLPGVKRNDEWRLPLFLSRATWVEFKESIDEEQPFKFLLNGIFGVSSYPTGDFLKEANERFNKFKQDISRLYTLLGAEIYENESCDKLSNFIALFKRGPIQFKIFVECVYKYGEEIIYDDDIKSFFFRVEKSKKNERFDKLIFVTNIGYSSSALEFANNFNIDLITSNSLYNQLVDFTHYIESAINNFEKTYLHKWYVEQTGSDVEDYESIPLSNYKEFLHSPLLEYVDNLVNIQKKNRIAILGNFGIGKTSFCLSYYYLLLKKYKENPENRIPVYLNLKEFRGGYDIHQILSNHLERQPGVDINLNLFLELQRLGRFVFILDSLDEMSTKVDRIVINENLREIDRLFHEGNNIYIISCRTHFFQEKITEDILEDYSVIFITEWGQTELKSYLQKRFGVNWMIYWNKLNSTIGLEELSKTPMLLEMIIKSISEISDLKSINLTMLYETYTNEWIIQQTKRRGAVMTKEQRKKFVEELSKKLYINNISELHFSELHKIAKDLSGYTDATRIDYFDTDARTSTFITKSSDGFYGFRHRSFLEYFSSVNIIFEINNEITDILSSRILPNEVLSFIKGSKITEEGFLNLLSWSKELSQKNLSRNCVSILRSFNRKIDSEVAKAYFIDENEWKLFSDMNSSNDNRALSKFFEKYYKELYSYALNNSLSHEHEEIEDAIQELMLILWRQKDETRLEKFNFKQYIFSAFRKLLLNRNRLRDKYIMLSDNVDFSDVIEKTQEDTSSVYDKLDIEVLLNRLSPRERDIISHYYLTGMSIDEITKKYQFANSAVTKNLLYRIRIKLREIVNNDKGLRDY